MTLDSGTRLGPYEIRSPIGAGGMGEVYKAKDTRLDRTVAIKVLPEHLSVDPEQRQRFEREARAVSSLNHPHFCTLHDIGHHDGIDFIVMEYIEGETLADRLKKGPLPLDQALQFGIQMADALDKVHRQGVVHRDLKPGNVMVTKPGVKLLDFGLAKFQRDASLTPEDSEQPTQQKPLTGSGAIVGTVQYMSPEQLEGKEADARSDIFAFGAVLYEMVTGRKAFEGGSQASLIGAILKDDPKPVSELKPTSPQTLDRLLKKSLAKDPEDRWHSAHDLMDELKWVAEGNTREDAPQSSEGRRGTSKRIGPLAVGILISLVAASVLTWYLTRMGTPPPTRVSVTLPAGQTFATENGPPPFTVSPDGRKLVYAAQIRGVSQLYIRDLERFESRSIAGTEGAHSPFFSPDGRSVGFFTPNTLKKVALPDGAPIAIADVNPSSSGGCWGSDDTIVYVPTYVSTLMRVPARGGTPESIITDKPDGDRYSNPQVLPDGNNVLFTITSQAQPALAVVSLETGQVRRLDSLGEAGGGRYVPTGHLVYGSSGSLLAVPFDSERQEIQGASILTLDEVRTQEGNPHFAVSETGTLIYVTGDEVSRSLVWVDRKGQATPPVENSPAFHIPSLGPDGRRVAFWSNDDIWIHDLDRGTHTRLAIRGDFPVWTPDGTRLAFHRSGDLYSVPTDGSDEPELILAREHNQWPMSWSPDGHFLAITENHPQTHRDIWVIPREGEPIPFLVTSFQEGAAKFSPGGRWLAYVSDESGRNEVYMQPFPGSGQKVTLSTDGGAEPVWSPGGGELFYRRGSDMMVVDVTTEPTFSAGKPRLLFSGDYQTDEAGHPSYGVSPDGQRFLMVQDVRGETLMEFRVVFNWTEELKRLVPTDN